MAEPECTEHHPACLCRERYFDGLEVELEFVNAIQKEQAWVPIGWLRYAGRLEDRLGITHQHRGEIDG